ncbi:MAG: hypothetical protein IKQ46_10610 [Bacteroidales bacterium]|nr:hypothetical protein [Bacteroidales bacterium]
MSSVIDTLIFDRNNANLVSGDPKGKYDYVDYNRVGEATNYVANRLVNGGYDIDINAKTDWANTDIPRNTAMTTYRANVKTIIDALELPNNLPTTNNSILTLLGANQIEEALYTANNTIDRIMIWDDVDDLNETWEELDAKELQWGSYFVK